MTTHKLFVGDSSNLSNIVDNSVNMIVTSLPYPMIEMWDKVLAKQSSSIETHHEGDVNFEIMA